MTFPPLAATVRRDPARAQLRWARTSRRLKLSMSGRIGSACSADTTSCASSRPRPSYTNRIRQLTMVSWPVLEKVSGLP